MISLIKLIDGTELIGELIKNNDKVVIKKPLQINYYFKGPTSTPVVALHKYMPFAKESEFTFFADHILVTSEPKASVIEYYKTMFKDLTGEMDSALDEELYEKASMLDNETREIAAAVLERAIKKPILN